MKRAAFSLFSWAFLGFSAWAAPATLAGLTLAVPAGWAGYASTTPNCLAEWEADGDVTVSAYYFGSAHAELPEKTLGRWASTMTTPEGNAVPGRISTRKLGQGKDTVTATEIDLYGTYRDPLGGPAPGLPALPRPGQGLLGAVLDYPGGPLYLCVTGPEEAVRAQERAFSRMVDGAHRGQKEMP
ncbi:MAG: hypothetical protein PW734_08800 [Verrucomicrobium sp.]|nr:hypothetical protein [Verrucomicrobium sp.]